MSSHTGAHDGRVLSLTYTSAATRLLSVGQLVERYGGRLSAAVAAALEQITEAAADEAPTTPPHDAEPPDLADVVGQGEARQALGTTRRVAIPLLEHLDRRGWTIRVDGGHRRVKGR